MKSPEIKLYEWKEKRRGKITSSILPDLMQNGKGSPFGTKAIAQMCALRYERRTGLTRESPSGKALDWGNENEPIAVDWLRYQLMNGVQSCSADFEDIVFNEPFEGFGDSPDAYVYDFDGAESAIVEIKCPMSQEKIEALQFQESIDEKSEYYYQFIGHFIGKPDIDKLYYLIFDGYTHDGKIIEMNRADHLANIQSCIDRIRLCHEAVNESLRSGKEFNNCINNAKEVLSIKLQIESLKPESKGCVPVQNQIYRLRKELKRLTTKK